MRRATAERLLSRLNPRTQSFDPPVQGGVPAHTPAEIVACLSFAGLPPIAAAIVRMSYLDDPAARDQVSSYLRDLLDSLAEREGWRRVGDETRATLVDIVIDGVMPRRCPACKGRRTLPNELGKAVACSACVGHGIVKRSSKDKAALMQVSIYAWYRVWAPREAQIKDAYTDIEGRVLEAVRRVLG